MKIGTWEAERGRGVKKIYIASPYTVGDTAVNVKRQIDTASKLMDLGFVPFWPLHSHFLHMAHPKPYEDWLNMDFEWLPVCDAVLRLSGDSSGAEKEVVLARQLDIPVFSTIDELVGVMGVCVKTQHVEAILSCGKK